MPHYELHTKADSNTFLSMIFQLTNILGGALVHSSYIKRTIQQAPVQNILNRLEIHQPRIGLVILLLGVIALLERISIINVGISGSSFPQALPAILIGLTLSAPSIKHPLFQRISAALAPYRSLIGIVGIACGLGSLLFGCVLPLVCQAPFGI